MDCCFARSFGSSGSSVEIRRPDRGTYVKGRWQTQNTEELKVVAVIQPLKPEEVMRLEDSRHVREAIKLYTQTQLFAVDINDKVQPDIVFYQDHEFEVESVADWESFYKVIAVRREKS